MHTTATGHAHTIGGLVDRVRHWFHHLYVQAKRLYAVTADSTKLHVEREHQVIRTHIDYHNLGEEVYRLMESDVDAADLRVSDSMRVIVRGIKRAKTDIDGHDVRINRMTVVSTPSSVDEL